MINSDAQQVEIYRQGKQKEDERPRATCGRLSSFALGKGTREVLDNPLTLSGEDIMPGLVVDLSEIFD